VVDLVVVQAKQPEEMAALVADLAMTIKHNLVRQQLHKLLVQAALEISVVAPPHRAAIEQVVAVVAQELMLLSHLHLAMAMVDKADW
jgi:hypothetical protein